MKRIIENAWIVTMNASYDILKDAFVYIEDDRIREVGTDKARAEALAAQSDERLDAGGMILMPGMVNAHTHMFQTFMRGLADDKPLFRWLREEIWPFSERLTEEDVYAAALLGSLENLKTGATGVIDQHYIYTSLRNGDMVFRGMKDAGIRGNLCRCFANVEYYPKFTEDEPRILEDIRRLKEQYHGAENGRLTLSVGPLNPWGVTSGLMRSSKALARELGLKFQVHTAETEAVVERTAQLNGGLRNVTYFDSLGVMDADTQLAHAVWLDDAEMELVARSGALTVHCPVANMYLASGVARIPEMVKQGTPVALATDGPGSNNSQDMMSVLKYTACLHKIHTLDAQVFEPRDILEMAVHGGAAAMGRTDLGRVEAGCKADLVLVNWKKLHIAPVHRPDSALVYNANGNDVDTVLVDGEIVVRGGRSTRVDEDALIAECQSRVEFIRRQMGR